MCDCVTECRYRVAGKLRAMREEFSLRRVTPPHDHQSFQRLLGRCFEELRDPLQSFAVDERTNYGETALCLTSQFNQTVFRVVKAGPGKTLLRKRFHQSGGMGGWA